RLRQHVVVERDGLSGAPFGITAPPLLGDQIPVGIDRRPCFLIFPELATIFRHGLRRCLRHCFADGIGKRRHLHCRGRQCARKQPKGKEKSEFGTNQSGAPALLVASAPAKSARKNCGFSPYSGSTPLAFTSCAHFFSSLSIKAA